MHRLERKYRIKAHIVGGGLVLREGEIVEEWQLRGLIESLKRAGCLEELTDRRSVIQTPHGGAYTA